MVSSTRAQVTQPSWRFGAFFGAFLVMAILLVGRLGYLMILQHPIYSALASDQQEIYQKLFPERGDIAVRDAQTGELLPVATNRVMQMVVADPRKIKDPVDAGWRLAPLLGIEIPEDKPGNEEAREKALAARQVIVNKLAKKDDPYELLARQVSDETVEKIRALGIEGIRFYDELVRYYPEAMFGGPLLGFLGYDEAGNRAGRYGIEGSFQRDLAGKSGFLRSAQGKQGGWIDLSERTLEPAEDGQTLVLSIDRAIQYFACEKLRQAVTAHGAEHGEVVILDPKTGAVLAMCSAPDFDPNQYNTVTNASVFANGPTYKAYEPGSVMKVMTIAAAIDAGALSPRSTYEDKGELKVDQFTIRNSDKAAHGVQTMTQMLEKSLNLGAVYAMQQTGQERFLQALRDFGFGAQTGIGLTPENAGTLAALDKNAFIFYATASYGQGITATTLQLASAFSALANNGVMMKPYLIAERVYGDGTVAITKPEQVRQVVSPRTASLVSGMMVSVVENGHGRLAGVPGYFIAGKTGTAQVAMASGGYDPEKTIGTFAGYGPVEDPRFVMVTRVDKPADTVFAEKTAAPLFGEIASFLVKYLEIPPTRSYETP